MVETILVTGATGTVRSEVVKQLSKVTKDNVGLQFTLKIKLILLSKLLIKESNL